MVGVFLICIPKRDRRRKCTFDLSSNCRRGRPWPPRPAPLLPYFVVMNKQQAVARDGHPYSPEIEKPAALSPSRRAFHSRLLTFKQGRLKLRKPTRALPFTSRPPSVGNLKDCRTHKASNPIKNHCRLPAWILWQRLCQNLGCENISNR